MRQCILDTEKICNDCMECDRCDKNPDKICDNCCECIREDAEYTGIEVVDVVTEKTDEYLQAYFDGGDDGGEGEA